MKRSSPEEDDCSMLPNEKNTKTSDLRSIKSDWIFSADVFLASYNLENIACGWSLSEDLKALADWLKSGKTSFIQHVPPLIKDVWYDIRIFENTDTKGLRFMKNFQSKMFSWIKEISTPKENAVSAMALIYCEILCGLLQHRRYGDTQMFEEMFDSFDSINCEEDFVSVTFDSLVYNILKLSESERVLDFDKAYEAKEQIVK